MDNMSLSDLAEEYMQQYRTLTARVEALTPLKKELSGNELLSLEKKIVILKDMALDCRITAYALKHYYEEEK